MLHTEAKQLGVDIRVNSDVKTVRFDEASVILTTGEIIKGDVVIGFDGKSPFLRTSMWFPVQASNY